MTKTQKIVMVLNVMLFLFKFFSEAAFSEPTASFAASCYVPQFVTASDGQKVLAESQNLKQELMADIEDNEKSYVSEKNPNLIQQEEKIVSEDKSQVELITTVCAK